MTEILGCCDDAYRCANSGKECDICIRSWTQDAGCCPFARTKKAGGAEMTVLKETDVGFMDTPQGKEPYCRRCGADAVWVSNGEGGWWVCLEDCKKKRCET